METFIWAVGQIVLVVIVYSVAYKKGYDASQAKAMSVMERVSGPLNELFDKLNQTVDEVAKKNSKAQ